MAKDENFFGHHQAREVRILGKFSLLVLTFFASSTVGQIMSLPYPTFERIVITFLAISQYFIFDETQSTLLGASLLN